MGNYIQEYFINNSENEEDFDLNEFKMFAYLLSELSKLARNQITQNAPATPNITPRRRKIAKSTKKVAKTTGSANSHEKDREKYLLAYCKYFELISSILNPETLSKLDDDICILFSTELIIII